MENRENLNILTDEDLVLMAREGSLTAQEYLIEKYRTLAKEKARIYYIIGADREDVIQEGMIGIFKAIKGFEPDRDVSFSTFVELCVTRQIITAVQAANRKKHQPLNQSLPLEKSDADGENETPLMDTLTDKNETDPGNLLVLKEIMDYLTENEDHIFSKFENQVLSEKLKGKDYAEIAETLKKKPKSVDNALQRIKKKIAAFMDN